MTSRAHFDSDVAAAKAQLAQKAHAQSSEHLKVAKAAVEQLENRMLKLHDTMQTLLPKVLNGYNNNPKPTTEQLHSWMRQLNSLKSAKTSLEKHYLAQKQAYIALLGPALAAAMEAEVTRAASETASAAFASVHQW